jgi:multidrug transporter EmrE-like cation transporter
MTSRQEGLLLVATLCVASFFFQTQLKILANTLVPILSRPDDSLFDKFSLLSQHMLSWRVLLVIVLAGSMFALWFLALMRLELSVALPLATIALVINSIGGGLFIGEALSALRMAGVLVVALGVTLVLLG